MAISALGAVGLGTSILGSVGGAIWNGIAGGRAARERERSLDRAADEVLSWRNYTRRRVGGEREFARRMFTHAGEVARQRQEAASGRQAVMGGGSNVMAAESAATNREIGNLYGQVNANQDRQNDAAEAEARRELRQIESQRQNLAAYQQKNSADAVTNASAIMARAGGSLGSMYGSVWDDDDEKRSVRNPSGGGFGVGGILYDGFGNQVT